MKHIRTGFEGYFSTLGLNKGLAKGSHNKVFWAGALNAILNKQPFFAADPFIGCDMAARDQKNRAEYAARSKNIFRIHLCTLTAHWHNL